MTLTKLCKLLGWPRLRRWSHVVEKIKEVEEPTTARTAIAWPNSWRDRGAVRHFDDRKNYPKAKPGIIYARRIAVFLNYPIERVLKYHMLGGPNAKSLPDWWKNDRYGSAYCTEDQAEQIVERIRWSRGPQE